MSQQQFTTMFPMTFNPMEHELPTAFNFITRTGKYPVVIQKAYLKPTNDGTGNFLAIELKIQGGEFDGIVVTDRVNVFIQSLKGREFAMKQLTAYCTAVGINQAFNDASVLVGRQLQVQISASEEPSRDNPDIKYWKNEVTERFYADGTELVRGNWGGQQQPQNGFAQPAAAPQGYAQPAAPQAAYQQPVSAGYAQPTAAAPQAPAAPAPTPVAPQAPVQPQQQVYADPNAYAQQQQVQQPQVAPPAAPQAPVAPAPVAAPIAPQAPAAPQGGFAPPAAGVNPTFAPPQ